MGPGRAEGGMPCLMGWAWLRLLWNAPLKVPWGVLRRREFSLFVRSGGWFVWRV